MEFSIITRSDALNQGLTHYFTGNPCQNGHISLRWTACGRCISCRQVSYNKRRVKANAQKRKVYIRTPRQVAQARKQNLARYNLTIDQYNLMLKNQEGVCAICKRECPSGKFLAVDHNHNTGKVRALLCMECNTGLGKFRDSQHLLMLAINYLSKY